MKQKIFGKRGLIVLLFAMIAALCVSATCFILHKPADAFAEEKDEDTTGSYTVSWQYWNGGSWAAMPDDFAPFTYNATDYSLDVRALLTVADSSVSEEVYAKQADGAGNIDENRLNKTDMYLTFSGTFADESVTTLLNATTYTVTIAGEPNYSFAAEEDKSSQIKVKPGVLDLTAADFEEDEAKGNRLWVLDLGEGTSDLRDHAVYYKEGATSELYGENVAVGTEFNAYVRFNGESRRIILNEDFALRGTTLGAYGSSIERIEYIDFSNVATPIAGGENPIYTTVRIHFNENFAAADTGVNYIELTKVWYIVTINNVLRTYPDAEENTVIGGYTFGESDLQGLFRPEHGDTAIYTVMQGSENAVKERFAVVFGEGMLGSVSYYNVKAGEKDEPYAADLDRPINDGNYFSTVLGKLNAGTNSVNVYVPAYTATAGHTHWWDDSAVDDEGVVYYPISRTYNFTVSTYALSNANTGLADSDKTVVVNFTDNARVFFNGSENNVPELTVTFNGTLLEEGVDYELLSPNKNVTAGATATLIVRGKNNFSAQAYFQNAFEIMQAVNSWEGLPSIMYWSFGGFDKNVNVIRALPKYGAEDENAILFSVATDANGTNVVAGLKDFRLTDGVVDDEVANLLATKLEADVDYYLCARFVSTSANYTDIASNSIPFRVFRANNYWDKTPAIASWVTGRYDETENAIVAKAHFGEATAVVTDEDGNKIDDLASLAPGKYTLTASVEGTRNYTGLATYTFGFEVFKTPGLVWWAVLLVAGGALLVVAVVIFILWKKGVFRILTGKIVLAIRTRANVDAAIASVRAARRMEEGRKTVEEAKRRERIEALRKKAQEIRDLSPEERADLLEARAQEEAEKAEQSRVRSERMQARAERMRTHTQQPDSSDGDGVKPENGTNAENDNPTGEE